MSFIKITDPKRRDELVADAIKTRRNIRESSLREKMGEAKQYESMSKFFKPVTDVQKETSEKLIQQIKTPPVTGAPQPLAITYPSAYPTAHQECL